MLFLIFMATAFAQPAHASNAPEAPHSERLWRSDNAARPEAIHVSADGRWVYVGNQGGNGGEEEPPGQGYIARMDLETGAFTARWSDGFDGPLGITSQHNRLFLVDRGTQVVALDIETGQVTDRWPAPAGDRVLNDLAIDPQGRLWVTDSRMGQILRLEHGVWSVLLSGDEFARANGIEYVDGWIYVVSSGSIGNLIRINPETLETTRILSGEGSLDGVVTDGRGGLLLGDIPGRLLHWSPTSGLTVLDDFAGEEIMINSIGSTPDGQYLFAPHWRESQISAYRIHYPGSD